MKPRQSFHVLFCKGDKDAACPPRAAEAERLCRVSLGLLLTFVTWTLQGRAA